jgi:hypothetical protein
MLAMIRFLVRVIQDRVEALARHRDLRPRSADAGMVRATRLAEFGEAVVRRGGAPLDPALAATQIAARVGFNHDAAPAERLEDQGVGEGAAVRRPDLGEGAYAGKPDVFDEPAVLAVLGVVRQSPVVSEDAARQIVKVHWASASFPLAPLGPCGGSSPTGSNHRSTQIRRP